MMRKSLLFISLLGVCSCGGSNDNLYRVLTSGQSAEDEHARNCEQPQPYRWVVAPHPDDEVLMAAGYLQDAVSRGGVLVVLMTLGDYDCRTSGTTREQESLAALAQIGIGPEYIAVLGYPDGSLMDLNEQVTVSRRLSEDGRCETGTTTYRTTTTDRPSLANATVSQIRLGHEATYIASEVASDLRWLMEHYPPAEIVVTHEMDDHPDHTATYALIRGALEARSSEGYSAVRVLRAFVHEGACWPQGDARYGACSAMSEVVGTPLGQLPQPFSAYAPSLRVPYVGDVSKATLIELYTSQAHSDPNNWLFSFARTDEAFFEETIGPLPGDLQVGLPPGVHEVGGRLVDDLLGQRICSAACQGMFRYRHEVANGHERATIYCDSVFRGATEFRPHGSQSSQRRSIDLNGE